MGTGQNKNINRSLEKSDFNSPRWLWGVLDFNWESNWSCGRDSKRARSRIGTWRYFWIATISSFTWIWMKIFFLWVRKKKVVSWDDSAPGKDAVMIVEMTRNNLEYYINLVDKAMAGVEWMTPLKYILVWVKCYQIALQATEKSFMKGKGDHCGKLHCCLILRNCHTTPTFSNRHDHSAAINTEARPRPSTDKNTTTYWRLMWWLAFFSNRVFSNYGLYIFLDTMLLHT